jgi:hypothetical protein
MKSLKITKNCTDDYTVVVAAGNISRDYPFDSHAAVTIFVTKLKKDGYIVVNDNY